MSLFNLRICLQRISSSPLLCSTLIMFVPSPKISCASPADVPWPWIYDPELLICSLCAHAVNPNKARKHLQQTDPDHLAASKETPRLVEDTVKWANQRTLLFLSPTDDRLSTIRAKGRHPHIRSDRGYGCQICRAYFSPLERTLKDHVRFHLYHDDLCEGRSSSVYSGQQLQAKVYETYVSSLFAEPACYFESKNIFGTQAHEQQYSVSQD